MKYYVVKIQIYAQKIYIFFRYLRYFWSHFFFLLQYIWNWIMNRHNLIVENQSSHAIVEYGKNGTRTEGVYINGGTSKGRGSSSVSYSVKKLYYDIY